MTVAAEDLLCDIDYARYAGNDPLAVIEETLELIRQEGVVAGIEEARETLRSEGEGKE